MGSDDETGESSLLVAEGRAARIYAALMAAVVLLQLVPIWSVRYLPLLDYPNHLARVAILGRHATSAPFQAAYFLNKKPFPNLALDVFGVLVQRLTGTETAGKIFLSITIALFALGLDRLARAFHGRASYMVPAASFFLFNVMFIYGFANYMFGVALFFVTAAYWIRRRESPTVLALSVSSVLALACYLSHLSAFAFFGIVVGIYGLFDLRRKRPLRVVLLSALPLAAPSIVHLLGRVPGGNHALTWDGPFGKLKGIAWLFVAYRPAIDLACTLLLAVGFGLCLLVATRRSFHPEALCIAVACWLLFFVFPTEIAESWAADRRFLIPAMTIALLSARFETKESVRTLAVALSVLAIVIRVGLLQREWASLSDEIATQVELQARIDQGARVYPITFLDKENKRAWLRQMAFRFTIHYATIARDVFSPTIFAHPSKQPLALRDPDPSYPQEPELGVAPAKVSWDVIFARYAYLWTYRLDAPYLEYVNAHCELVEARGATRLYRSCRL